MAGAPAAQVSRMRIAWVGSTTGFQPLMVPSIVSKISRAGPDTPVSGFVMRQGAAVGDAAALSIRLVATGRRVRGVVVGDGSVDQRRGATGRDAGPDSGAVAVDRAATDRQGAVAVDAAALVQGVAVVDGARAER